MQLQSSFQLPLPLHEAWAVVENLPMLARCLPNVTVESITGDRCEGALTLHVGLLALTLHGEATIVERNNAHHAVTLHASGCHAGTHVASSAEVHVQLLPRRAETIVAVVTDVDAGGPLGRLGQVPLAVAHDRFWSRFGGNLSSQLRPTRAVAGGSNPLRGAFRRASDTARAARSVAVALRPNS